MAKWTDYTTDTNPTDTDEVMTLDADKSPKANKRVTLSTLADYFLDKLASKVFAKLETENKTVIGALNELNSKAQIDTSVIYYQDSEYHALGGVDECVKDAVTKNRFPKEGTFFKSFIAGSRYLAVGYRYVNGTYGLIVLYRYGLKQSKTVSVSNATSIQELVNSATRGTNILFHLAGAGYTGSDLPNDEKYKYGSGIVFYRNSGSCKIVLIPEELKPVWKMSTWTKWKDFANNIVD